MLAALTARWKTWSLSGLGYLSLDRESTSRRGGESQRVKMVRHLGSSLTDITYIFDEPSVGLHPHDVGRMAGLMQQLRDTGNTVLIVEHKPDMIAIADHVVDMGPFAGTKAASGGLRGGVRGAFDPGTLTGIPQKKHQPIKDTVRKRSGRLKIGRARLNNLKDVSVTIPKGVLTAVSGVAGSGKSSLIAGCLPEAYPETIHHRPEPRARLTASNTATYTGILGQCAQCLCQGPMRSIAALFSANSKGGVRGLQWARRYLHGPWPS